MVHINSILVHFVSHISHYVNQKNLLDPKAAYSDGYNDFRVVVKESGITLLKQLNAASSMYHILNDVDLVETLSLKWSPTIPICVNSYSMSTIITKSE